MSRIIVITGTDTGTGKTVLTALLATHLCRAGGGVAALKPVCSGNRDDARALQQALDGTLTLDEINPWHFRAALAPMLAARRQGQRVALHAVAAHVRQMARRFDVVLVEGAGGLLSPLGENFSTRELIMALGAEVIIVGKNRLGVVNHLRLTLEALPATVARRARLVLMNPPRPDAASRTNPGLLAEFIEPKRIAVLPWLQAGGKVPDGSAGAAIRRTLDSLICSREEQRR